MDFLERHFGKIWVAMVVACLLFWGTVIFVAGHFILKAW